MGGQAVSVQGGEMRRGAVALVALPQVAGVAEGEQLHESIANRLGDDGRGRDALAASVAVDDRGMGHAELGARQAVHEHVSRRTAQPIQRPAHRQDRGAADVEPVDLVDARRPHTNGQGARADGDGDLGARRGGEPLRIVEAAQGLRTGWKHDGRGDHRTRQRTAADLVDAGDEPPSLAPERRFALERGTAVSRHVEGCSDASGDSPPGTPSPRCSRMRAALPASRRRKYNLARRTRPLRTSATSAIAGECSGKMRSTPTPAEILRTVNVSSMPPPRRAMHTPSNACSRSFSPSRTRTITRTVSPGLKAVTLALSPSRRISLMRSIRIPSMPLRAYASRWFAHRSGRRSRVSRSASACRHAAILAWSPLNNTSGTLRPRYSGGRV